MVKILILFVFCWYIVSVIMWGLENLILFFKPNLGKSAKILSAILTFILVLIINSYSPYTLIVEIDNVYNAGIDDNLPSSSTNTNLPSSSTDINPTDSSKNKSNPFGFRVVSNALGSTPEFNVRNLSDAILISVIGKSTVTAMNSVSTLKAKAVVGTVTATSLGTIGAGYKLMNQSKFHLTELSERFKKSTPPPSPTNDNFTINDSFEGLSSLESLTLVIFCIKLLLVIILFCFIWLTILNWILNKVNILNNNEDNPHYFKFLSKDNKYKLIKKLITLTKKSGKIYINILSCLIILDLVGAIYLINEVMLFIKMLSSIIN